MYIYIYIYIIRVTIRRGLRADLGELHVQGRLERLSPVPLEHEGLAAADVVELAAVRLGGDGGDAAALLADLLDQRRGEVRLDDEQDARGLPDAEHAGDVARVVGHQERDDLLRLAVEVLCFCVVVCLFCVFYCLCMRFM